MTVIDNTVTTPTYGTLIRVLVGADGDPDRLAGKVAVAQSDCTYYCPDAETGRRVIEALRSSDERLRSRPDELMLWDWQSTYWEAEFDNLQGGGTVRLGVSWFEQAFFDDRRDAWFGGMHSRIYQQLGIPIADISVTHWVALPGLVKSAT